MNRVQPQNAKAELRRCVEFSRVVGKSLRQEFYEALDHHSPRLMEIFKAKRGLTGQVLADLMRQTKASDVTEVRCLVLRGLPVILGDDPSSFFKACFVRCGAKKKASEVRQQTNLTGAGVNTAQALNDEEERAMAIIGFSASRGIPGGMDIHAGITEEGDPSREQ
ncbi:unnamed protein product [Arctogadus glacialis]